MRGRWFLLFLLLGCQQDFFPAGLYDYQVERLLSGGASKVWNERVNSTDCADSVRLYITLLTSSSGDSVTLSTLTPRSDCGGFDTTLIGNANASSPSDGILFTDSLVFANGDSWIVESITSSSLSITTRTSQKSYSSN